MQDKITINPFDPDSIDEAIKKLEKRKERIHKCAEKLIQRLTDLGVEKAQELVPVDTGTARASIIGYLDEAEGVGIISAGGYCKYIEFGTGVKGRDSSHPSEEYKAIMNWAYNSGATIFTTKDGREGWYYPADDYRGYAVKTVYVRDGTISEERSTKNSKRGIQGWLRTM